MENKAEHIKQKLIGLAGGKMGDSYIEKMNNNTIGNHQNKPSEIVGWNNVCSLGDFCRNELFLIHTNMDDQDKDWLLIKKDDVFADTHVYDAKIIPSYDEVFL